MENKLYEVDTDQLNKDPSKEINRFDDEYQFLSNMYHCEVTYNGLTFQCSEAAFQSAKYKEPEIRERFTNLKPSSKNKNWKAYGNTAKRFGGPKSPWNKERKTEFDKKEWNDGLREQVMLDIIRAKFSDQNPDLQERLLATGNAVLVEGTWSWKDNTWGVALKQGEETGRWKGKEKTC